MVEAMYENSHDYFRQFKKQFKFYTTPTKPCLSSQEISYIIGYHPSSSVIPFCSLSYNHYHVLCEILPSDKNSQKSNIPCLVNCFFHLFRPLSGLIVVGTLAAKLQSCVSIIFQLNPTLFSKNLKLPTHQSMSQSSLYTKSLSNSDNKRICSRARKRCSHSSLQSPIPSATLDRITQILQGPFAIDFYQTMDIFVTGEGCICKKTDLYSFNLKLSSKIQSL